MRAPSNTYIPVTLASMETRVIVLEDMVAQLPLYDACVWIRNIDPLVTVPITVDTVLNVTAAGILFNGSWENRLVDTDLDPEAWLRVQVPVSCMDGAYARHRLTLTNPGVTNVYVHVLVNGSIEAVNPPPTQTFVVIP